MCSGSGRLPQVTALKSGCGSSSLWFEVKVPASAPSALADTHAGCAQDVFKIELTAPSDYQLCQGPADRASRFYEVLHDGCTFLAGWLVAAVARKHEVAGQSQYLS